MQKVYSIFDKVAEVFNNPFLIPSRPVAMRTFSNVIIDGKDELHKNPGDYQLMELGSFDPKTARYDLYEAPQVVLDGDEVINNFYAAQDDARKKVTNNG